MCILTNDDVEQNSNIPNFKRKNYIAVYEIKNVRAAEEGLKFELTKRLIDLI